MNYQVFLIFIGDKCRSNYLREVSRKVLTELTAKTQGLMIIRPW